MTRTQNGRSPHALCVEIADGATVDVVEKFAELPATRSVEFSTAEVWRPVRVYASGELLGELRLCEPPGYDGGLRTAVHAVVTMHVDADAQCYVGGVECALLRMTSAGDEYEPELENDLSVLPASDGDSAEISDGRLPYALHVETGDGTWLTVVEMLAELPATRSAEFSTAEVWRPVRVYASGELLGELRLCEPPGYDGGLRTAVNVVITVHVDVDAHCYVGVECVLFGLPYAGNGYDATETVVRTGRPPTGVESEGLKGHRVPVTPCEDKVHGGGYMPYALSVEIDDGTMLGVVEAFAELPVTRSVNFLTADVRRPIGVYAGNGDCTSENERLGELRLCEPLDYDHCAPCTMVNVVVVMNVDADGRCYIRVWCTTIERPEDRANTAADDDDDISCSPRTVDVVPAEDDTTCEQRLAVGEAWQKSSTCDRKNITVTEKAADHTETDICKNEKRRVLSISDVEVSSTRSKGHCGRYTSHAIGIEIVEGVMKKIVEKYTDLPTTGSADVLAAGISKSIGVYAGDSVHVRNNAFLGELRFDDGRLPAAVKFVVSIRVEIDGHCFVSLEGTAVLREIGHHADFSVLDGHVPHALAYGITREGNVVNLVEKYAESLTYTELTYHLDFLTAYIEKPIYADASAGGNGLGMTVVTTLGDPTVRGGDGRVPHASSHAPAIATTGVDKTSRATQGAAADLPIAIAYSDRQTHAAADDVVVAREHAVPRGRWRHDDRQCFDDTVGALPDFLPADVERGRDVVTQDAEIGRRENVTTTAIRDATDPRTDYAVVAGVSRCVGRTRVAVVVGDCERDRKPTSDGVRLVEDRPTAVNGDSGSTSRERGRRQPCEIVEDGDGDDVRRAFDNVTAGVADSTETDYAVADVADDETPEAIVQHGVGVDAVTRDPLSSERAACDPANGTSSPLTKKKKSFTRRVLSRIKETVLLIFRTLSP